MSASMKLFIRPDGTMQCLYGEVVDLGQFGALDIRRASHVEPDPEHPGTWFVDLAPVGGPRITGYATRAQALNAEELWLHGKMRHTHVEARQCHAS